MSSRGGDSGSSRASRRVYVGKISARTQPRDIEDAFRKYGKVVNTDVKTGFAFVEFEDERDAEDAIRGLDGSQLDGERITVEASHSRRDRDREACFSCGGRGHWSRDCPTQRGGGGGGGGMSRDRGRCYSCNGTGHISRDCPRGGGRGGSRGGGGGRDYSRGDRGDYSRGRSPSPRSSRSRDSRSPSPRGASPRRERSRSPRRSSPDGRRSPAPANGETGNGRSPVRDVSPAKSPL